MTEEQKQLIVNKLMVCMNEGSIPAFIRVLKEDLSQESSMNACLCIGGAIFKCYTSYNSDMLASFLSEAIHFNMNWPKLKGGKNPLFRAAFLAGSCDLYICLLEEVKGLKEDDYAEIYCEWQDLNEVLLDKEKMYIKGRDYNSGYEANGQRILDLNDFDCMDCMAEKYNAIIGRHRILKDLEKRL